jgi:predicted negative regulator of RcsB-dependent stress response
MLNNTSERIVKVNSKHGWHYDKDATAKNYKELQKLFDDYKNKDFDKEFNLRLGKLIYQFQIDDHNFPLFDWIWEADWKGKYKVMQFLLNGKKIKD